MISLRDQTTKFTTTFLRFLFTIIKNCFLFLFVPVPPRCVDEYKSKKIGALKRDTLTIECQVKAEPSTDVKFSWTFNTSGDVLPLPATRVTSLNLKSHIDFTPISDSDFGTLACWAVNSIGRQKEPCMIHIYPASKFIIIKKSPKRM